MDLFPDSKAKVIAAIDVARRLNKHLQIVSSSGPLNGAVYAALEKTDLSHEIVNGKFGSRIHSLTFMLNCTSLDEKATERLEGIFSRSAFANTVIVTVFRFEKLFSGEHLLTLDLDL